MPKINIRPSAKKLSIYGRDESIFLKTELLKKIYFVFFLFSKWMRKIILEWWHPFGACLERTGKSISFSSSNQNPFSASHRRPPLLCPCFVSPDWSWAPAKSWSRFSRISHRHPDSKFVVWRWGDRLARWREDRLRLSWVEWRRSRDRRVGRSDFPPTFRPEPRSRFDESPRRKPKSDRISERTKRLRVSETIQHLKIH